MSNVKRLYFPETYALIDGARECLHENYDAYFEECEDCGMPKDKLIEEATAAYYGGELAMEEAERIRDGLREDGINV